ncbi:MAG: hypothetical protein IPP51_18090 [Bacteroidetes bacterium]|nr:hypothetical protein [Bacteroidota bacterium]
MSWHRQARSLSQHNGGSGPWTQVVANNTFDLEFKPTSPDTVYAGGLRFRRSTDGV